MGLEAGCGHGHAVARYGTKTVIKENGNLEGSPGWQQPQWGKDQYQNTQQDGYGRLHYFRELNNLFIDCGLDITDQDKVVVYIDMPSSLVFSF
jgi:hypothetical protein